MSQTDVFHSSTKLNHRDAYIAISPILPTLSAASEIVIIKGEPKRPGLPGAVAAGRCRGKVADQFWRRGIGQEEQRTVSSILTSATRFHQLGMTAYAASKDSLAHLVGYGQTKYDSRGVRVRNLHLMHNYTDLSDDHGMEKRLWPWDLHN